MWSPGHTGVVFSGTLVLNNKTTEISCCANECISDKLLQKLHWKRNKSLNFGENATLPLTRYYWSCCYKKKTTSMLDLRPWTTENSFHIFACLVFSMPSNQQDKLMMLHFKLFLMLINISKTFWHLNIHLYIIAFQESHYRLHLVRNQSCIKSRVTCKKINKNKTSCEKRKEILFAQFEIKSNWCCKYKILKA